MDGCLCQIGGKIICSTVSQLSRLSRHYHLEVDMSIMISLRDREPSPNIQT